MIVICLSLDVVAVLSALEVIGNFIYLGQFQSGRVLCLLMKTLVIFRLSTLFIDDSQSYTKLLFVEH